LFERIDLVDQLRLRHAKVVLAERGWIGHMPLLANPLYLGGLFAKKDAITPWRNEPIRAGSAGGHVWREQHIGEGWRAA